MKKAMVLALLFFCVFVASAVSAQRPEQTLSIGAGYFGGMPGASADLMIHVPKTAFGTNDLYARAGVAVTDSKALTPDKDWRKFCPLYIDAVYYFNESAYVGGGLNFPLKVSDGETGNIGTEIYLGMDLNLGMIGRGFTEIGCSSLRRMDKDAFEGLYCVIGWRYDLSPAVPAPAQKAAEQQIQPVAPTPEAAQVVPKKTLPDPERTNMIINLGAEIEVLQTELTKVHDYVAALDNKIAKANKSGSQKKVSKLVQLKNNELSRADNLSLKIEQKQKELSALESQN